MDRTAGMRLDRDNYNLSATHAWTVGNSSLNQFAIQFGQREFDEPNNSQAMAEYVLQRHHAPDRRATSSATRTTPGTCSRLRDTFYMRVDTGTWAHDLKFGGAWQMVSDDWTFPGVPERAC